MENPEDVYEEGLVQDQEEEFDYDDWYRDAIEDGHVITDD